MSYSNSDKLVGVLSEWLRPAITELAKAKFNNSPGITAANAWVVKYFPVSKDYSLLNDFGFLIKPSISAFIKQGVINGLAKLNVSDGDIPSFLQATLESMYDELKSKDKITLFGLVEFEQSDIDTLQKLLISNGLLDTAETYEVIK